MPAETLKKVQGVLFRGEPGVPKSLQPPADARGIPGLAIHIPKAASPAPTPNPPPKLLKVPSGGSPKESSEWQPYRDRVFEKLGGEYRGVENYRLLQDEERERHWKKWGPYLSERQWVRAIKSLIRSLFLIGRHRLLSLFSTGDCT